MQFFTQTWFSVDTGIAEVLKLVIGTSSPTETLEIRKKIAKYCTSKMQGSTGNTFIFTRQSSTNYFALQQEISMSWQQVHSKIRSTNIYFPVNGTSEDFRNTTYNSKECAQLINQLHIREWALPVHTEIGSDTDPDTVTPVCCQHEEGVTPILSWIICKKCGKNMREIR